MAGFNNRNKNEEDIPPMGMPEMGQPYYDQNQPQNGGMQDPYNNYQDYNQQQYPEQGFDQGYEQQNMPDTERFEEIAEAIINEKWNELIKDINKVVEWKERTDTQLKRIEQEIMNLKERFESLHKGVLGKVGEYDQNLTNVGTEIKAMQMAFKKIMPTFVENVNKLERLAKK